MPITRRGFHQAILGGAATLAGIPLVSGLSGCGDNLEAKIITATTNSSGIALLHDEETGLPIEVTVQDQAQTPLPGVEIAFVDSIFNAFALHKSGYTSHFQTFAGGVKQSPLHAATKPTQEPAVHYNFILRSGMNTEGTIFEHEPNQALFDYERWAFNSSEYRFSRCMTKEELIEARNNTFQLISHFTGGSHFFKVVSAVYDRVVQLEELGVIDNLPDPDYAIFEPTNPALPPLIIGRSRAHEVPEEVRDRCKWENSEEPTGYVLRDEFNTLDRTVWGSDSGGILRTSNGYLEFDKSYIITRTGIDFPSPFTLECKADPGNPATASFHILLQGFAGGTTATGVHAFVRQGKVILECFGGESAQSPYTSRESVFRLHGSNERVELFVDGSKRGEVPCALEPLYEIRLEAGTQLARVDYIHLR